MNRINQYFTPLIAGVMAISLSSCAAPSSNHKTDNPSLSTAETINTSLATQLGATTSIAAQPPKEVSVVTQPLNSTSGTTIFTTPAIKTIPISIYRADSQCQTLVPEKVAVPAASPVDAAVGTVLKEAASGDFDLAGYRVNVNANSRVATVDLRLSPDSRRKFVSLSTCEQFALFGSLRKTLTANSQLNIKDVRFMQQGQEIKF